MPRLKKPVVEDVSKMTLAQCKKAYARLAEQYKKITEEQLYCHECGEFHAKSDFYKSIYTKSGVNPICKTCLKKIGTGYDEKTKTTNETRDTIISALKKANLPFIEDLYQSCSNSVSNEFNEQYNKKKSVFSSMIVLLQSLPQYYGMTFDDSDFGESNTNVSADSSNSENKKEEMSEDVLEMYKKNKRSTFRMLGYDPFENEEEEDKPLLYSKLVNYFDDSLKDDGFKLEAVIEIVQTFKDVKHINDTLTRYTQQLQTDPSVISSVKQLASTKKDMLASALALAKDNGISENNNNKKSKGAGSLSGIIKEMSEMNLREAEVNTFDYETMQAIDDIMTKNHQNQLRQLNPDENDWQKEIVHQKDLINKLQKQRDEAVELCRLLKVENKDLKDFLQEKGMINSELEVVYDE